MLLTSILTPPPIVPIHLFAHTALLPARHSRWYPLPVAGAVAPEGKAREGEEEEEEEDSPPPQRGAEPKKTIPKAKYTGKVSALYDLFYSVVEPRMRLRSPLGPRSHVPTRPDMNKLNALIKAGIDIRWRVRRN